MATAAGAFVLALVFVMSGGAAATGGSYGHYGPGGSGGSSGDYALASVPGITSIAVSPTEMFVTSATNCTQVWSVSPSGTVSLYAVLPIPVSKCGEGSVALAPWGWGSHVSVEVAWSSDHNSGGHWGNNQGNPGDHQGNWGGNGNGGGSGGGCGCGQQKSFDSLWDVQEGQLFEISDHGSTVTLFATFSKTGTDMGLTYDSTGNFSHDLVVTGSSGRVWTVSPAAVVTLIANLNTHIEGPAVAPWSFGAYAGDALVASTPKNAVYAVSPTGTITKVTKWKQAESIAFPSDCRCGFGTEPAVFFVANVTSGTIEAYPASYFTTLKGLGFVDGEINGGIGSFTSAGTTTTLQSHTGHLEQIAFVQCFGAKGNEYGGSGGFGGNGQGW